MSTFVTMHCHLIVLLIICLIPIGLKGQRSQGSNLNLQSSYLYEIPGGDLAERYGPNSKFEFKLEYLSAHNLAYYVKGGIRINQNVKEDVLSSLRTKDGFVIGVNGFYADLFGRKRGYDIGVGLDKLIPIKSNMIRFGLAGAFITHFIKFVDDSQSVPSVINQSGQFFDRYVSGFGIEENVQYQINLSENRAAFMVGLQLGQFFTKEHRAKLISGSVDNRRFDLYFGLKVTYLLPLRRFGPETTVFY